MESINFNLGSYKEYAINGDENNTIRLDVSDYGYIERFQNALAEIEQFEKEFKSRENPTADILSEMDKKAREIVNKIFCDDVCAKVFGSKNCLSNASNGQPNLINFLNAIKPIIERDFGAAIQAQQIKLEEKTDKYTKPVLSKPPIVGMVSKPSIDIDSLTKEQKNAILAELLK